MEEEGEGMKKENVTNLETGHGEDTQASLWCMIISLNLSKFF